MDTQKGGMRAGERHASPQQIKADIDYTRSQLDETINAMTRRLSPTRIIDRLKQSVSQSVSDMFRRKPGQASFTQTARDSGQVVMDAIKEHPIPLALIGAGISWLLLEQSRMGEQIKEKTRHGFERVKERGRETMERMKERAESLRGRAGHEAEAFTEQYGEPYPTSSQEVGEQAQAMAGEARHRARQAFEGVKERTGRVTEQARQQYEQACQRSQELFSDYPLAFGLGAMAIGLGIGLALPSTRREEQLMGEQARQVKEKARQAAQRTGETLAQRGKDVAKATTEAATEELRREGLGAEGLREKTERIVERTTEAATEAATHGRHEGQA